MSKWKGVFARRPEKVDEKQSRQTSGDTDIEARDSRPPKWSFGILNDKETDEVPG
jgi:hypothetical protein